YFGSLLLALGVQSTFSILSIILLLAPPIILLFTVLFILRNNTLRKMLNEGRGDSGSGAMTTLINSFPFYGMVLLVAGCAGGPVLTVVIGIYRDVFVSVPQGFYFFLIGAIQALIAGGLFYYTAKILLYPLSDQIEYSPLSLFHKLLIPILSSIMILLLLISVGIYKLNYNRTEGYYVSRVSLQVKNHAASIGSLLGGTLSQLQTIAQTSEIRSMNINEMKYFLQRLHREKNENVEMLFAVTGEGISSTSMGSVKDISDRAYFREVMKTGKPVFSEPVISRQTGKKILVAAAPVKIQGRTAGAAGATILLTRIDDMLSRQSISDSGRFMVLSEKGKILFHPDNELVGKTIGKEIVDDGDSTSGIGELLTSRADTLFYYRFNGNAVVSYKTEIPVMGGFLVFSSDEDEYIRELNVMILNIITGLLLISIMLYLLIWGIAKRFSVPIQNTITVIKKLSDGDLTASSNDYVPDEFGDLIRSFKRFRIRLREVIESSLNAVEQLSGSSEQLADTSQGLSENAQAQAASIEETSASVEEVASSIELINRNADTQTGLVNATYRSMEELKKDNEVVVSYASRALDAAQFSTEQTGIGSRMMENTITGMNKIDESTKKIAEMVMMISDISDQVNLLALNASIEAARAGEHGRGFAVVAEEISKLADKTAASAKDISSLVTEGLQEVNNGRGYVDSTSAALQKISEYIAQTGELVKKITDSSEKQSASSDRVLADTKRVMEMADSIAASTNEQMLTNQEMSKTIEQINQGTQGTAAGAEEIASAAEEISAQAESLKLQMEFFKV
ncbi:MAG TPA: methyl-accepting chemotaxis protein, partial [Spirochaetota bacterium]|nr:methyl-accepting chemotaxis protein [Spirochaetota bacterium]